MLNLQACLHSFATSFLLGEISDRPYACDPGSERRGGLLGGDLSGSRASLSGFVGLQNPWRQIGEEEEEEQHLALHPSNAGSGKALRGRHVVESVCEYVPKRKCV